MPETEEPGHVVVRRNMEDLGAIMQEPRRQEVVLRAMQAAAAQLTRLQKGTELGTGPENFLVIFLRKNLAALVRRSCLRLSKKAMD